jgi:23S rRNA pseudouridine1911/1915/1917 synthase
MSNKTLESIAVLYEDTDIVAVNKPAGLMVHPDGRAAGPFLTDWIREKFPSAVTVGEPARGVDGKDLDRFGIVHRLDRDTSGVLLIAKTQAGFDALKGQFQDRTVTKKYLAFVWGAMEEEFGTIDRPIGRNSSDFRRWSAQRGARGEMREAETYWTKVAGFQVPADAGAPADTFSLIEAVPKTGRTHQIRVHFAAIQRPVVGDILYAPKRPMALGFERLALHSRSIEFEALTGKRVLVEAPLPVDFIEAKRIAGLA